jgi:hypothetical protein
MKMNADSIQVGDRKTIKRSYSGERQPSDYFLSKTILETQPSQTSTANPVK